MVAADALSVNPVGHETAMRGPVVVASACTNTRASISYRLFAAGVNVNAVAALVTVELVSSAVSRT